MKSINEISRFIDTNFTPIEVSKEGLLRGGYGDVYFGEALTDVTNECTNQTCPTNNCPSPSSSPTVIVLNIGCSSTPSGTPSKRP